MSRRQMSGMNVHKNGEIRQVITSANGVSFICEFDFATFFGPRAEKRKS